MRQIYTQAVRVLVWLGHDSSDLVRAGMDVLIDNNVSGGSELMPGLREHATVHYRWQGQVALHDCRRNLLPYLFGSFV